MGSSKLTRILPDQAGYIPASCGSAARGFRRRRGSVIDSLNETDEVSSESNIDFVAPPVTSRRRHEHTQEIPQ